MDKANIKVLFNEFRESYNEDSIDQIWREHSIRFKEFWNERIMPSDNLELNDPEIDEIVRILDRQGKGNTRNSHSIAKVMIPQGAWRRLFNQLKDDNQLSETINKIFLSKLDHERSKLIDELFEINEGNKNNLTGKSGNAINCLLAAYDPFNNLSIVSLNDRKKLIPSLDVGEFNDKLSTGLLIEETNTLIKNAFRKLGSTNARTISKFVYSNYFKDIWKNSDYSVKDNPQVIDVPNDVFVENDEFIFYMEKQLEDFLIENWDKTELGEKYELINDDDGLVSQQYRTEIGIIDILVRDKNDGKYVIIELKKNQTSDNTIGQIARYMGWVEEHLSNGEPSKGIIIAGKFDKKLKYAMRKIADIEVYLYQLDFKLKEYN